IGLLPTLVAVSALMEVAGLGGLSLQLLSLTAAPETAAQSLVRLLSGAALLVSLPWWLASRDDSPGTYESAGTYAGRALQRGTLGRAFSRHAEAAGHALVQLNRPDHDLTDFGAICKVITTSGLDIVVHAAAYTNVDGAESEPETAFLVNGLGTRNVAIACAEAGIPLIYISTNMVFDGIKGAPYTEFDAPCPK